MTAEQPAETSWQQILSTLASHRLRGLYAALVLGQRPEMTAKERQKLLASGLVRDDGGALAVAPDVFKAALAAARTPEPTGPERFLAGGLVVLPHRAADRLELLGYLRDSVIAAGETMAEKELNARLAEFTTDVPMLRRAMVDYGFLIREPDGSAYRRGPANG
ncbi:DUF2087 domain-containing protein [Arthrobacter sp. NPDC089319]|uniref:DUF2087 domain-containing protein n=1 Tax=Arthrobacter sp. NPDC089319 TaxID=3155915 RepID=UPI0034263F47